MVGNVNTHQNVVKRLVQMGERAIPQLENVSVCLGKMGTLNIQKKITAKLHSVSTIVAETENVLMEHANATMGGKGMLVMFEKIYQRHVRQIHQILYAQEMDTVTIWDNVYVTILTTGVVWIVHSKSKPNLNVHTVMQIAPQMTRIPFVHLMELVLTKLACAI
jgi:hypothetical protein